MRAILVDEPNAVPRLTTVPEPALPPHGALVAVRATGVCRSDWHAWVGHDPTVTFPHVPGHEFAGVVEAVGDEVERFRGGERVTAPFCCGCGRCATCRSGHQNLCEREFQPGFDGWGSFAEHVVVPWADVNLVELPAELGFDEAASLGCRFTTAYAGLVHGARVHAGETVAVFGCGGVGLSCVAIAAALGARVVAVDVKAAALEAARGLGAHDIVDASHTDPVDAVLDRTGGVHVAVDALGSPDTCAQGVRSLRRRGRHLQLGLLLADAASPRVPVEDVIRRELRIVGSHGMQAWRYGELFAFVAARDLPLGRLIGDRRPLADAGEALAAMGTFAPTGVTVLHP
jgi:alcohol dehydrogenase